MHHRDNPSARPLLGHPIVSRTSGEWVIPVSRRVNDVDGKFAGVVLATLSVKHVRAVLDQFQIGEQGAITLFHAEQLMVRRPFKEADMGRRNTRSELQKLFVAQRSGTVEARSTIDDVHRIITFDHMRSYPVLVTVALGKDEALSEWRTVSIYQSCWALLLCLLIGLSGGYLIRAVRARVAVEARLRETRDALSDANERLEFLAENDELTGLHNRRHFDARLRRAFRIAQQEHSSLAIVMVDVDEFKKFNDLYGHVEGDACLRRVADVVRSVARRSGDLVARYGGEEMVMLLPQTNRDGATQLAQAACDAVMSLEVVHAGSELGVVSISLGVAAWAPEPDETPMNLLKAADAALYRAKGAGRHCVSE